MDQGAVVLLRAQYDLPGVSLISERSIACTRPFARIWIRDQLARLQKLRLSRRFRFSDTVFAVSLSPQGTSAELALIVAAERAREHYDRLAVLYRLFWGEHLHHGLFRSPATKPRMAQVELLRYCSSMARVQPASNVLDVGCGYGGTAIYLAEHYGCRCTGLTISAIQAEHARKLSLRAQVDRLVQFVVCNAETHPFGSETYDLVWVMEASEHFAERAAFFERAAHAVRRGGTLLLTCWAVRAQTRKLERLAEVCACQRFQTIAKYIAQVSNPGLRIRHCEELTSKITSTWEVVSTRTLLLMPTLRLWPRPIREFAGALGQLRQAFDSRELQYWLIVAGK